MSMRWLEADEDRRRTTDVIYVVKYRSRERVWRTEAQYGGANGANQAYEKAQLLAGIYRHVVVQKITTIRELDAVSTTPAKEADDATI